MDGSRADRKLIRLTDKHSDLRSKRSAAITALFFFFIVACSGPMIKPDHVKGIYHQVKKGETLWRIAKAYHTNLQELAELNNITDTAGIKSGDVIFIPGADRVIEQIPVAEKQESPQKKVSINQSPQASKKLQKPNQPTTTASGKDTSSKVKKTEAKAPDTVKPQEDNEDRNALQFDKTLFIWPLKGNVVSKYGIQPNGFRNNGIKIAAQENTPVLAVAAGEVTYSDTLKYYGDTIILRHDNNFSTVYSSLKERTVKVGDHVKKGDHIALLAKTDSNNGACLNFEIRQINKPRNPLFFLP